MRISDWSSDGCSSDLPGAFAASVADLADAITSQPSAGDVDTLLLPGERGDAIKRRRAVDGIPVPASTWKELAAAAADTNRSEEHTSELQSLMRISYAVFCLKKKNKKDSTHNI